MQKSINKKISFFNRLLQKNKLKPSFIILGVQRCGTTTLYNYLIQHPQIVRAISKEVHFFDLNFSKGLDWYLGRFSLKRYLLQKLAGNYFVPIVTGEASPYYIFHPLAPKRIAQTLPSVKVIVLLRNPVDRAYSQYQHEVCLGNEKLPFEEAINKEEERLNNEVKRMLNNENYDSFNHLHYSYLSRGIYIEQIKILFDLFPKENILILKSEDFYSESKDVCKKVISFLNLPFFPSQKVERRNKLYYQKMDPMIRERLNDYFKDHNQKLYEYLGVNLHWD